VGRAYKLRDMLHDAGITRIFTSTLRRTIETAKPIADQLHVTSTPVADALLASRISESRAGDRVLVVGHSNTIPPLLRALGVAHTYGRLVQRIRDAGAEIAYTEGVFSPFLSFASGWTMVLSYAIVCPWEAVATGNLLARVFPSLNSYQLYAIAGAPIYAPRLAVGLALTALVAFVNYRGIKPSGLFQDVMTFGLLVTFAIFTVLGFAKGSVANMQPFFSQPGAMGPLLSIFLVMQIVPYFMTGFESVAKG